MRLRRILLAPLAAACVLPAPAASGAAGGYSHGTPEQIAWVRRAATNFLTAELAGDGAGACNVLAAPLKATLHHRSCQQRWDAKLRTLRQDARTRRNLHADLHAVAGATVVVHANHATIALPTPLLGSASRFWWSENCWMLQD